MSLECVLAVTLEGQRRVEEVLEEKDKELIARTASSAREVWEQKLAVDCCC